MLLSTQTLLALAAAAASVTAVPTPPLTDPAQDARFQVENFTASCVPHSTLCKYDFDVFERGSFEAYLNASTHCSASAESSNGLLPRIIDGGCHDSGRQWNVTVGGQAWSGLVIKLWQQVSAISFTTAEIALPAWTLYLDTTEMAHQQKYIGPTSFGLFDAYYNDYWSNVPNY